MTLTRKRWLSALKGILLHLLLALVVLIILYPIVYTIISSFKRSGEILAGKSFWPEEWRWSNYVNAWEKAKFADYTWNTIVYSVVTMILAVLGTSLCGYVFARGDFPGRKTMFAIKSMMMFLALGSATMYPQLQVLARAGLNKSIWGIVLVDFCTGSVAYIFMIRSFILTLPKELDEAAMLDGCSFLGTFFRITLPLIRPVVATIAVLSFKGAWNNYLFPMIVTFSDPARRTLAVGLHYMSTTTVAADWSLILPGTVISALPLIIVYTFFNKYFIESLNVGAVKG